MFQSDVSNIVKIRSVMIIEMRKYVSTYTIRLIWGMSINIIFKRKKKKKKNFGCFAFSNNDTKIIKMRP